MSESRDLAGTAKDVEYLLSPKAIRERCAKLRARALAGQGCFVVHLDKVDEIARITAEVTRENYPDLRVPFHSRWKHFQVGGGDRLSSLEKALSSLSKEDRSRAKLDLAVVSVLLDAGAGDTWKFWDARTQSTSARSEGLAVASLRMFEGGAFSQDPQNPLRVDGEKLAHLTESALREGFQVSGQNPLDGFEGRVSLMRALGRALVSNKDYFIHGRPGNLLDRLKKDHAGGVCSAPNILTAVQRGFGSIWPGRLSVNGFPMGDVWTHAALGEGLDALVPFHKLSQWMTYSLVDPLEESGLRIDGFEGMTALAEYRNGGLLIDGGVLSLRNSADATKAHAASSELIVEWRALTVSLLEDVAVKVRALLKKTEAEMPLGKVLEGGTWFAGRKLAAAQRPGGGPPLKLLSDGTVF